MLSTLLILAVIAGIIFYVIGIYNKLVKNQNLVKEGWSGIDVQLKQRANLIPNLLETVKGYVNHEKTVFTEVTEARASAMQEQDVKERGKAEGLLGAALGKLFAVAENYPELKANENFSQLQTSLETIENNIQLARRYYNGTVRDLNILVESFPSNLIANQFQFKAADYFEIDNEADRAVPEVKFAHQE